jgi:hypothetical protein
MNTNRIPITKISAVVPPFLEPVGSALGVSLETMLQLWPDTIGKCVDLPFGLCELSVGMRDRPQSTLQSVQSRDKRKDRKLWEGRLSGEGGSACGRSWSSSFPVLRTARGWVDGHSRGDNSGVRTQAESGGGDGDGRRKRGMTETMATEMRWHDKLKPLAGGKTSR